MIHVSNGYAEGFDYLKLVFNNLSPASIKLLLNLSGHRAPDICGQFTYAELGAGFGVSIAGWAAQYPQAVFHSIDYNLNQAAWSKALAAKAGLDNLHVHGMSVLEALALELPKFDFIVAHGLYSWVNNEVRQEIRTFIKTLLKPDGCVYISYNAMPGSKDVEPMRHLIMHELRTCASGNPLDGMKAGIALLEKLMECGAAYFAESPQAKARLSRWLAENPKYLAAELLAGSHKAYHFSELAGELKSLRWAGWAGMINYLAAQEPPAGLSGLLEEKDFLAAETIRDMFYNTAFRTDIFLSAATEEAQAPPGQPDFSELLDTPFSLGPLRKPLPRSASRHNFEADLSAPVYTLLQGALTSGPRTLARLAGALQAHPSGILRRLCVLAALDWVHPGPPLSLAGQTARMVRFNCALSELSDENSPMPILSAHGGWIRPEEQLEHLAILARLRGEPAEDYLCRILYPDDPEASPAAKGSPRKSIRLYLSGADKNISLFLRRHGLDVALQ